MSSVYDYNSNKTYTVKTTLKLQFQV